MDSHILWLSMARPWRSELRCDCGFLAPAPYHTYRELVWDLVADPQTLGTTLKKWHKVNPRPQNGVPEGLPKGAILVVGVVILNKYNFLTIK